MGYVHCLSCVALHWSCCSDLEQLLWPCGAGWVKISKSGLQAETNKQTTIAQKKVKICRDKNKQTRTTITQKRTKRDRTAFKLKLAGLDRSCSALAAPSQLSPSFLLTDVELLGTVYMAVPHIVHLHCLHCLYGRCQLSVSENDQVMSIVSFTDRPAAQVQISTDQPKCSVDNRSSAIFYV